MTEDYQIDTNEFYLKDYHYYINRAIQKIKIYNVINFIILSLFFSLMIYLIINNYVVAILFIILNTLLSFRLFRNYHEINIIKDLYHDPMKNRSKIIQTLTILQDKHERIDSFNNLFDFLTDTTRFLIFRNDESLSECYLKAKESLKKIKINS